MDRSAKAVDAIEMSLGKKVGEDMSASENKGGRHPKPSNLEEPDKLDN